MKSPSHKIQAIIQLITKVTGAGISRDFLIFSLMAFSLRITAEETAPADPPGHSEVSSARSTLLKRFTLEDGKPATIGVLRPLSVIGEEYAEVLEQTIESSLLSYGNFQIEKVTETLDSTTLEEIRRVIISSKSDVLVISALRAEGIELFLFDRRTPYLITHYAQEVDLQGTDPAALPQLLAKATRITVRNLLFAYMKGESAPIQRESSREISEIHGIQDASRMVASFNREITSTSYISASFGASLSVVSGGLLNSNSLDFQYGRRISDDFFAEFAVDMFSYNLVGGYLKYFSDPKNSLIRYSVGAGLGIGSNSHTIADNPAVLGGSTAAFIGGTGAVLYPIGDLLLKVEGKALLGTGSSSLVFMLLPGLTVPL